MTLQSRDIIVELTHVGDGQVVATGDAERSAEDLILDPSRAAVRAPLLASARNLRLLDGVTGLRPGYSALGTKPDTDRVTGLYQALFDNTTDALLRFTPTAVYSFAGGSYTDVTAATPPAGTDVDFWDATMVRRAGSSSPGNQVFAVNGVASDYIQAWTGAGAMTLVNGTNAPRGVKTIAFFSNYAFAGNVVDASGDRRNQRLQRASLLDPTDWDDADNGAGFVDLREDPYPIAKVATLGGNQVVLKGSNQGGALYGGIETGRVDEPIEYELLNRGVGIGLLIPRSFLLLEPATAFFVGHNGFYIWDGAASAPQRVADTIVKSILRRINYDALGSAFASYFPVTDEVIIHIPTGSSDIATEAWIWNRRENRTYGPWIYADGLACSTLRADSGALTWTTFDYPGGWGTIPFATWAAISGGTKGLLEPIYGAADGKIVTISTGRLTTDDGTAISAEIIPGTVTAAGRSAASKVGTLTFNDMMILREIGIRYRSDEAWTPVVAVSIDGGNTFVTVSDGGSLVVGHGELRYREYTATGVPGLGAALRFIPRVTNSSGGALPLHSLRMRFEYGGDARNAGAGVVV